MTTSPTATSVPAEHPPRPNTSWVWLPVALVATYYGLPALVHLDSMIALVILVPGLVAAGAVAWRRHRPRLAYAIAVVCLLVSPAALGGVIGVLASRARHRTGRGWLPEIVACTVGAVMIKAVQLMTPVFGDGWTWTSVSSVEFTISTSAIGFAVLAGLLARSSAQSAASERVAEQARAAEIRLEERARIAREMHDVVAHRISLVAMTSGALVYRDDLPPDAHEAATIIQTNARQALSELRAVLSDLRSGDGSPVAGVVSAETPQPTLDQLPVLLAEAREATDVNLTCDIDPATLPSATSRQLYRIVQEGLTNARKHAPGQPVSVRIERAGSDIVTTIRNPMTTPVSEDMGGGYGLVGIQERARMLGGQARVDVVDERFMLTVTIPARLAS